MASDNKRGEGDEWQQLGLPTGENRKTKRLRPLHDKDYPDSRMMNFLVGYTPERHLALQKLLAEWSGDSEMPRNFDFMMTIMGRRATQFEGPKVFEFFKESGSRGLI